MTNRNSKMKIAIVFLFFAIVVVSGCVPETAQPTQEKRQSEPVVIEVAYPSVAPAETPFNKTEFEENLKAMGDEVVDLDATYDPEHGKTIIGFVNPKESELKDPR